MKLIPINITKGISDYEGNIEVYIPEINQNITCSFVSISYKDMVKEFPIHTEIDAILIKSYSSISETDNNEQQLGSIATGIYRGKEIIDGDEYYKIESSIDIFSDNELSGFVEPTSIGKWVQVTGEYQLIKKQD